MKLGLLWYDADPRLTPKARLADAAGRYVERFGKPVNCCHVNPAELFDEAGILIVADPSVRRNHIWVGRDESLEPAPRRRRPRRQDEAVVAVAAPAPEAAPAPAPVPEVAVTVEATP